MGSYLKHTILFVVSLMVVFSTVFALSAPVQDKELLKNVSFGYPFAFLSQNMTLSEGFLFFPSYFKLSFDFQKYPLSGFSFTHFIADFLIIFGIIEGIVFILEKCKEFLVNRRIWPYSKSI